MSKNTGRPYEKLTQRIFSEVLNRNEVQNIEVKHNITLPGLTTDHQIDIYWEFERGGIKYVTIVQAKDRTTRAVDQGELLKFKAVLDDIPNQPRGVFVTRTGYQEGALAFAASHGIPLYVLREPIGTDYPNINVNLCMYSPHAADIKLVPDEQWTIEAANKRRLSEVLRVKIAAEQHEVAIYTESGIQLGTMKDIIDDLFPKGMQELPPTKMVHQFEQPTFIKTGVDSFPDLKINAVEATVSVNKIEAKWAFDINELVGVILEDIISGVVQTFDKDGKLRNV